MLKNNNGNLFKSNNVDGSNVTSNKRKRVDGRPIMLTKYKKFADMPLTDVQKVQVKKMATRQINGRAELKYDETNASQISPTLSWQNIKVSLIAQGNLDSQRQGDEIYVRDIELRLRVEQLAGGALSNAVRLVLVQYYQDDVTPPTGGSVMNIASGALAYISHYSHDLRRQYKILYDETFYLSSTGPTNTGRVVITKPGRAKVRFDAAGQSGDGQIYLYHCSDQTSGASTPTFDYNCRVNFTDA